MSRVLLDVDPLTDAFETMEYDTNTGQMLITKTQQIGDILDMNEYVRNDASEAWRGADNSMWHVGAIPDVVYSDWLKEFNHGRAGADRVRSVLDPNPEWQRFWWAKFTSSDYYKFRLTPKKL